MNLVLSNLNIHTEAGIKTNSRLVIHDHKIQAIQPIITPITNEMEILEFPANYHLIPGFIDLHVHGANGNDVMDSTPEALACISQALAREGTTRFLATTMTAGLAELTQVLQTIHSFSQQNYIDGAKIAGIHLEGPFISPHRAGAQLSEEIWHSNIAMFQQLQKASGNLIKLVTLAPEIPNALPLIDYLQHQNIIAAMGHTNATYAEALAGITAGCSHATHLFNAMRAIHQREPGVMMAALLSDDVTADLIADGIHLHPAMIQLALKTKSADKLMLITDAMRAKCLQNGEYELGGQKVTVENNKATLADGTLAGSLLAMNKAVHNMLTFADCTLTDIIKMTSENPARKLGIFSQTGSISTGKYADLVILDQQFNVVMTICEGKTIFTTHLPSSSKMVHN